MEAAQTAAGMSPMVAAAMSLTAVRSHLPARYGNYGCLVGVILGLLLLTPFFATLITLS